jgi:uncharacterized protein YbjT (DUF2867 family)
LAPVLDGVVALPAGDIREPIADVDDIADVAVAALTDARHDGELYEITGPRLLSFAEAAAEISAAAGIPVHYQSITLEQFHEGMLEIGGPLIADVFTEICRETLDGHNAYLTDGVQRALGREPTRLRRILPQGCRKRRLAQSGLSNALLTQGNRS